MKVLLLAYACEPQKGSESGVGWRWAEMLSTFVDLTVLTRANNRAAIEAAASSEPWVSGVRWVYHDMSDVAMSLKKATGAVQAYYVAWQYSAVSLVKDIIAAEKIDLVHHLTFGSYWMPSLVAYLDAPLVFGPVGGAESAPLEFAADRAGSWLFEATRTAARRIAEANPAVRRCARTARVCVAKAPETAGRLRALGARDVVVHSEVVVTADDLAPATPDLRHRRRVELVSVGRLHHLKGYQLALDAIAARRYDLPQFAYTLVGEGPHRAFLERRVRHLGLDNVVTFLGARSRGEVIDVLRSADIFLHPSLHDSGGWACIEAMAAQLPVVCLDIGGPATQVGESCGVKVPVTTRARAVAGLSDAIVSLANDGELARAMGVAGRARVEEEYTRAAQLEWLKGLYASVAQTGGLT